MIHYDTPRHSIHYDTPRHTNTTFHDTVTDVLCPSSVSLWKSASIHTCSDGRPLTHPENLPSYLLLPSSLLPPPCISLPLPFPPPPSVPPSPVLPPFFPLSLPIFVPPCFPPSLPPSLQSSFPASLLPGSLSSASHNTKPISGNTSFLGWRNSRSD